jgi:cell wall-associated NlpC family hydrolase
MGGTTKKGVDCSGFVRAVYRNAFHVDLPRTTAGQIRVGIPVSRHALRPGDLVFFSPPGYPRHVGIYLDNNRFLHASKSTGVTMSAIEGGYWAPYFRTARRILPSN